MSDDYGILEADFGWRDKVADRLSKEPAHRCFVTLTCADNPSLRVIEKRVASFFLRSSRYSTSHITALAGFEVTSGHTHAHAAMFSDKPIDENLIGKRWKWGKAPYFSHSGDLNDIGVLNKATHYIFDHENANYYHQFCPNPKSCNDCSRGNIRDND